MARALVALAPRVAVLNVTSDGFGGTLIAGAWDA
jgi:hypothetical protein